MNGCQPSPWTFTLEPHFRSNRTELGRRAAVAGAEAIRAAIAALGEATIVLATGASQFDMLAALTAAPAIAWNCVTAFHLDEYTGLASEHPASFRGYRRKRFVKLLEGRAGLNEIDGEAVDAKAEGNRLSALLAYRTVDVCSRNKFPLAASDPVLGRPFIAQGQLDPFIHGLSTTNLLYTANLLAKVYSLTFIAVESGPQVRLSKTFIRQAACELFKKAACPMRINDLRYADIVQVSRKMVNSITWALESLGEWTLRQSDI